MTSMAADTAEHVYVGQYSQPTFGITTRNAGTVANADGAVSVSMTDEDGITVFTGRTATNVDTGTYEIVLGSVDTQTTGAFVLRFDYLASAVAQVMAIPIQIGGANAAYDDLTDELKRVVESVWHRFADLYDSPIGGAHLAVYAQTHFGRGRIAQLMEIGLGRLNTLAQPHTTYSLMGDKTFPVGAWGAVLEQQTYVEVLKHLIRSYVEQPDVRGSTVAYLDRRDYMARWQAVLQIEQGDLKTQLEMFKMAHMGLGRPGVIVSGGIYGNWGPMIGGHFPARPNYYYRFQ